MQINLSVYLYAYFYLLSSGGVGTFDEFWDTVSHKSLKMKGMSHKPIVLVNINQYYDGFIMQIQRAFEEQLLYARAEDYFYITGDVQTALEYCEEQYQIYQFQIEESVKLSNTSKVSSDGKSERMVTKSNKLVANKSNLSCSQVEYVTIATSVTLGLIFGILLQRNM